MELQMRHETMQSSPRYAFLLRLLAIATFTWVYPNHTQARWAKPEDAPVVTESEQVEIEVAADFTYKETQISRIRILNEEGRKNFGVHRLAYNSRASRLKVLEAWSERDGKKIPVAPQDIQDKPLASARDGFDQINQIAIAYPDVEPGVILHLKTVREVQEIPFEKFFSTTLISGLWSWDKKGSARISAPFPLFFEENDPDDTLRVKETRKGNQYQIDVTLKKPIHFRVLDEEDVYIEGARLPRVTIASAPSWDALIQVLGPKWEEVLQTPLPRAFSAIARAAANQKTEVEQLNEVTASLSEKVRYWADWRPIRGGHVPRPLEQIARSGFGDCKDFSASTIRILRELGFEALPVFIHRGLKPIERPGKLPYGGDFNHAIVWAKKNGKEFWIDPTNTVSFAQGTFEDIIDRPALIVDARSLPAQARYARTPSGTAQDSQQEIHLVTRPSRDGSVRSQANLNLKGRSALRWAGDGLTQSSESIGFNLVKILSNENRLLSWKAKTPGLRERIVQDLEFQVEFTEVGDDLRTSAGPAALLRYGSLISTFLTRTQERESDLWLGYPIQVDRTQTLEKSELVGTQPLNCEIQSEWADIKRLIVSEPAESRIKIQTQLTLKKNRVLRESYSTEAWKQFQRAVRECFDRVAIVYQIKG